MLQVDGGALLATINSLQPNPFQPRDNTFSYDILSLSKSIQRNGMLQPISVRPLGDGYQIIAGERRWRAAQLVGLGELQAIIVDRPSEADLLCKKVSRALLTRNLTPQEELAALEAALDTLGVKEQPKEWRAVAPRLGIQPELLRDRMKITQLVEPVRREFERVELDVSAAQAFGRLEDTDRQTEVADFIKDNHLNTRFVGTKLIKHLTKNPEKPVMEV
ncbi:MAG: ParB/RepB/Spo0J family partition protein, partial [Planctomycetes bacterium]|nr:ParB/RepB/Spo0J family partition protein [Planctomycetota bacterium]